MASSVSSVASSLILGDGSMEMKVPDSAVLLAGGSIPLLGGVALALSSFGRGGGEEEGIDAFTSAGGLESLEAAVGSLKEEEKKPPIFTTQADGGDEGEAELQAAAEEEDLETVPEAAPAEEPEDSSPDTGSEVELADEPTLDAPPSAQDITIEDLEGKIAAITEQLESALALVESEKGLRATSERLGAEAADRYEKDRKAAEVALTDEMALRSEAEAGLAESERLVAELKAAKAELESALKESAETQRELEDGLELEQNEVKKGKEALEKTRGDLDAAMKKLTSVKVKLDATERGLGEAKANLAELNEERGSMRRLGRRMLSLSKERIKRRFGRGK
ncbi:hypothetical protein THAOC_37344 [Thalassiosira oceanica]|uniref:Uncharacterized protein n=1 Tax=Thalassiosira oceanica TaxID=159749 RepID=K0R0C9_THAOC|nr:hypothetical protein THAOC_37344 [Thalassiosira oceanica]|eukprot:EJK44144.1 hypothetical protein THAOC_37344 [Thalassiosira oceanica]